MPPLTVLPRRQASSNWRRRRSLPLSPSTRGLCFGLSFHQGSPFKLRACGDARGLVTPATCSEFRLQRRKGDSDSSLSSPCPLCSSLSSSFSSFSSVSCSFSSAPSLRSSCHGFVSSSPLFVSPLAAFTRSSLLNPLPTFFFSSSLSASPRSASFSSCSRSCSPSPCFRLSAPRLSGPVSRRVARLREAREFELLLRRQENAFAPDASPAQADRRSSTPPTSASSQASASQASSQTSGRPLGVEGRAFLRRGGAWREPLRNVEKDEGENLASSAFLSQAFGAVESEVIQALRAAAQIRRRGAYERRTREREEDRGRRGRQDLPEQSEKRLDTTSSQETPKETRPSSSTLHTHVENSSHPSSSSPSSSSASGELVELYLSHVHNLRRVAPQPRAFTDLHIKHLLLPAYSANALAPPALPSSPLSAVEAEESREREGRAAGEEDIERFRTFRLPSSEGEDEVYPREARERERATERRCWRDIEGGEALVEGEGDLQKSFYGNEKKNTNIRLHATDGDGGEGALLEWQEVERRVNVEELREKEERERRRGVAAKHAEILAADIQVPGLAAVRREAAQEVAAWLAHRGLKSEEKSRGDLEKGHEETSRREGDRRLSLASSPFEREGDDDELSAGFAAEARRSQEKRFSPSSSSLSPSLSSPVGVVKEEERFADSSLFPRASSAEWSGRRGGRGSSEAAAFAPEERAAVVLSPSTVSPENSLSPSASLSAPSFVLATANARMRDRLVCSLYPRSRANEDFIIASSSSSLSPSSSCSLSASSAPSSSSPCSSLFSCEACESESDSASASAQRLVRSVSEEGRETERPFERGEHENPLSEAEERLMRAVFSEALEASGDRRVPGTDEPMDVSAMCALPSSVGRRRRPSPFSGGGREGIDEACLTPHEGSPFGGPSGGRDRPVGSAATRGALRDGDVPAGLETKRVKGDSESRGRKRHTVQCETEDEPTPCRSKRDEERAEVAARRKTEFDMRWAASCAGLAGAEAIGVSSRTPQRGQTRLGEETALGVEAESCGGRHGGEEDFLFETGENADGRSTKVSLQSGARRCGRDDSARFLSQDRDSSETRNQEREEEFASFDTGSSAGRGGGRAEEHPSTGSSSFAPPDDPFEDMRQIKVNRELAEFWKERGATDFGLYNECYLPFTTRVGALAAYRATRESAAVFDVSFRRVWHFRGRDRLSVLDMLLSCDLERGMRVGDAQYAVLLDSRGLVLDDCFVAKLSSRVEVWLSGAAPSHCFDYVAQFINYCRQTGLDVSLTPLRSSACVIALQGPRAFDILADRVQTSRSSPSSLSPSVSSLSPSVSSSSLVDSGVAGGRTAEGQQTQHSSVRSDEATGEEGEYVPRVQMRTAWGTPLTVEGLMDLPYMSAFEIGVATRRSLDRAELCWEDATCLRLGSTGEDGLEVSFASPAPALAFLKLLFDPPSSPSPPAVVASCLSPPSMPPLSSSSSSVASSVSSVGPASALVPSLGCLHALDMLRMESGLVRVGVDVKTHHSLPQASLCSLLSLYKIRRRLLLSYEAVQKQFTLGAKMQRVGIIVGHADRLAAVGAWVRAEDRRRRESQRLWLSLRGARPPHTKRKTLGEAQRRRREAEEETVNKDEEDLLIGFASGTHEDASRAWRSQPRDPRLPASGASSLVPKIRRRSSVAVVSPSLETESRKRQPEGYFPFHGCIIMSNPHRRPIGVVTSCSWSPHFKSRLAQGLVLREFAKHNQALLIAIPLPVPAHWSARRRGRALRSKQFRCLVPGQVHRLPFVPHNYPQSDRDRARSVERPFVRDEKKKEKARLKVRSL
ncbi:glycine cleavage T-protein (aminomethyl transferase) domain-containing protein [Toxoplasma gondii TgCatPRC2]|uniref:Glycine cleavage T-protein (Aminomethyl transferase) domain-containing protein n=2 Tax=Toxoplasma gondii TaxID=5811 RepID=A0A151H1C6_TOXGO|nr:glycine cleavage T-protein (aminomethyl transferase) domain-containing protein [Toxoplasma gondii TgCatPRC2]